MVLENGTVMDVQHPRPGTDRLMHLRTGVGLSLLALVVIAAATAVVKQKPRKLNPVKSLFVVFFGSSFNLVL
ncbi:MAG: hypothetical protein ACTH44_14895, partial [Brevibacterium aurantiacum]|uniref:hypothetical protein n=1 Tax=Brevibacterium aurantiacum TaxID=273384 RepID=UPI003F904477